MTIPAVQRHVRAADACRWSGAALVLLGVCTRALTPFTDLPHWDMDPLVSTTPMIGLGPAGLMTLDALIALGAALIFLAAALAREPIGRAGLATVAAFAGVVAWHAWGSPVGTIHDQFVGSAWAAALIGALALAQACRDERVRVGVAACLLGLIAALCVKGAVQLAFEHPAMVEHFRENKPALLAAQGFSPDSPRARAYERRILQPEPTAWFALANVFGSFAAAGAVALGALAAARARSGSARALGPTLAMAGAALACAAMVVLSGSKGSFAALALGLVVVGVVNVRRCPPRGSLVLLTLACLAAPIVAVAVRGLLGERFAELSLLFRAMYWQGAARMVAQAPLVGVGPGGFQSAFTVLKPPLCPEDVRSAHNVFVDWWSTLGLAGLAGSALVVIWTVRAVAGIHADRDAAPPTPAPLRPSLRLALGVGAACTLVAARLEMHASSPEGALTRLAVLIAWALVAWAVARAGRGMTIRPALGLGALTLLVQSQIEVTATWPSSAALALALLASSAPTVAHNASKSPPWLPALAAALSIAAATLLTVLGVLPAIRWERHLSAAAAIVAPLAEIRSAPASELPARVNAALGRPVPAEPAAVEAGSNQLARTRIAAAADALALAWTHQPSDWRTGRELSGLLTTLSKLPGADAPAAAARAVEAAERGATLPARRSGAAVWAANVWLSIPTPDTERADAWYVRARERDPYNPSLAFELARLAVDRGRPDLARERAAEALRLQDFARLDPVGRALGDAQLAQLRAWAAEP